MTVINTKGYFRYEEAAQKCVDDLTDDIFDNLPVKRHKPVPMYYDKYEIRKVIDTRHQLGKVRNCQNVK